MRVLIAGAGGVVGQALMAAVRSRRGHIHLSVIGTGIQTELGLRIHSGDPHDPKLLKAALNGIHTAWYLVPRYGDRGAILRDPERAARFGEVAARSRVKRIVYLSALGEEAGEATPHVTSRRAVGRALVASGVPVTEVRVGMVVGRGVQELEILQGVLRGLRMAPRGEGGRVQPIALADLVDVLIQCGPPRFRGREDPHWQGTLEVGGPDVVTWGELLLLTAHTLGRAQPWLHLSSPHILGLFMSVFGPFGPAINESFVRGMAHDAVVTPGPAARITATPLLDALGAALARR